MMSWMLGSLSSGFAMFFSVLFYRRTWGGSPPRGNMIVVALMAGGLLSVFLKLGRPESWRAILRPQSSWMTRELYSVAVFFPAVAASYLWRGHAAAVAAAAAGVFLFC